MLITQFVLIIVDRGIYLRKSLFAKVIFQYLQVVFLHIWLFIFYPLITDRPFSSGAAPRLYYMVKCIYLLLSAYQIRSGYPKRILGYNMCRGYNYVHYFLFKGFISVPFLYELRMFMDFMWTDTSMHLFDWMKIEDIHSHIFQAKCYRHIEAYFPQPRGEKKPTVSRYLLGMGALAFMFVIIWFPLIFFSLGDTVGKSNIPYSATLELRIGSYEAIYRMTALSASITSFNEDDYNMLVRTYDQNKEAQSFLAQYQPSDIAVVNFSIHSASMWSITTPDRIRLLNALRNFSVPVSLLYFVSHASNTKNDPGTIRGEVVRHLEDINIRNELHHMISAPNESEAILFEHMVPQYIKVTNKGTVPSVPQLVKNPKADRSKQMFRNVKVKRKIKNGEWWQIKEDPSDADKFPFLKYIPYFTTEYNQIYTFNDKLFPQTLSFLTGGGVAGLYTLYFFVSFQLMRSALTGAQINTMWWEDSPYLDTIYCLILDIYFVREQRMYSTEEDLFAQLLFAIRSRETFIRLTQLRHNEINQDERLM